MTTQTLTFSAGPGLGRVANLPTVWSNGVAGIALAGGDFFSLRGSAVMLALSFFYVAGFYVAEMRPHGISEPGRPVRLDRISSDTVFVAGFGVLAFVLMLLTATSWSGVCAAAGLCAAIVFHDASHRGAPVRPLLMGSCRMLAYLAAGFAVTDHPPTALWVGAGVMLLYLIGSATAAKHISLSRFVSLWPLGLLAVPAVWGLVAALHGNAAMVLLLAGFVVAWVGWSVSLLLQGGDRIPGGEVSLVAGISLVDALFVGSSGAYGAGEFCLCCYLLTVWLQRDGIGP